MDFVIAHKQCHFNILYLGLSVTNAPCQIHKKNKADTLLYGIIKEYIEYFFFILYLIFLIQITLFVHDTIIVRIYNALKTENILGPLR